MDISQIIMVSVLLVVTLWRKDIILYLILAPVMVAMGLSWYDSYHTPPGIITSLALMLVGSYCFALGVFNMLKDKGE